MAHDVAPVTAPAPKKTGRSKALELEDSAAPTKKVNRMLPNIVIIILMLMLICAFYKFPIVTN
jgi:hypothetical protein